MCTGAYAMRLSSCWDSDKRCSQEYSGRRAQWRKTHDILLFSKNSSLFSFFQRLSDEDHWNLQVFWALVKEACIPMRLIITRMSVLLSTQWSHLYFDQAGISYFSVHMRKLLKPYSAFVVHTHLKWRHKTPLFIIIQTFSHKTS
jgi:hypothetical protein